ncbi:MAG: hypothetical protein IT560_02430 [Alphaproteobacteria bacterium]|nr:hypothetical protein [Alphaproteobacteria bacterium]
MKHFILYSLVLLLTASCASHSDIQKSCPNVSAVREIPFRAGRGIDEAYNRLRYDDFCEASLHTALTSLAPMPDPRQAPPSQRVVEGDVALILLAERHQIDISLLLPEDQIFNWQSHGMDAYFDYVSSYSNRLKVIKRLDDALAK